jgi:predicted phage tail protein
MFQRIIDDVKTSTGETLRQTSLGAVVAISLFVATAFLSAALFVAVLDYYGLIQACLADAGLFLVMSLIAALVYRERKRRIKRRAAERARSTAHAFLADPTMVATGIQIVRAIGMKRLLPILAVGGLALGLMAGRSQMSEQTGEQAPAE